MKVLVVSHSCVLKEHQQKLEILAKKHGVEVHLLTPPHWYEGGVKVAAYRGSTVIKYAQDRVFFPKKMLHFYLNPEAVVKKINPDIIHIEEEPFDMPCWEFVSAAKKLGKKALFFTWENLERRHNIFYTYFNNYSILNADAAIAGNEEGKKILLNKGFKKEVYVLPQYGVNLEDFSPHKPGNTKEVFNIAYIGRMTYEKGIFTLVNAAALVKGAVLHIAGSGAAETAINALIKHYKLDDRVKYYGHVGRESIPELLSRMDCLVLPSLTTELWKEQFGRVIIEAFAAGVPVIGSSSGEIPNVIGDAGIIFDEGNVQELAYAIEKLEKDKDLYKCCVLSGLERVKNNYTNEIIADKTAEIYLKLKG